ncbi:MAG TPA: LytR C-terminal domain-containing protein [Acidimicrobiia bacterium]
MADRGTQTGGSERGRGIPLGAGSQTVKGVLLVGAAVVLGIVLLQVVDNGSTGPAASRKATSSTTTTTTKKKSTTRTTTTTKTTAAKKPAQVHLLVLNAGAPSGSAASVSSTLRGKGYTNQGKPGNDPNQRVGKQVLCRAGLTREASSLAVLLGSGTTKGTLGTSAPPGSAGYDCVVLVGNG